MVFDSSFPWSPYSDKFRLSVYSGTNRLMSATAAHEFGHALGLGHENRLYNVMGAGFQHLHVNGAVARVYAGVDAGSGVKFLYGPHPSGWVDLGVVHWKYLGASDEYSIHTKTKLYDDTTGSTLSAVAIEGEIGYRVELGQNIRAEFTFENSGSVTEVARVEYYISTNDIISTLDRSFFSESFYLPSHRSFTRIRTLPIPTDLTIGENYWLGVIVDSDDEIEEYVEWNNATYIPIRIEGSVPNDDHGDDRNTATDVQVPSSTPGELETGGDVDMFSFLLQRTGRLGVGTTGNTDTFGTLYRHDGEVDTDNEGGTNSNFSIDVPAAPTGTYYVEVEGYSSSTTGSYTLEVAVEYLEEHVLPFLPGAPRSADGTLDRERPHQSGNLMVSNLGASAGEFMVEGFDGYGASGVTLLPIDLEPYETRIINVFDLEDGSDARGISPGLGDGFGDWRVRVSSALPLDVGAYTGGWGHGLTPLAPDTTVPHASDASEDNLYSVFLFNSGSNFNNRSFLVVVNTGDSAAQIRVSGHDLGGQPSLRDAHFTVAPGGKSACVR